MQKWEYMTVDCVDDKTWRINEIEQHAIRRGPHISAGLRQWGDEGWEICGVAGSEHWGNFKVFLKRPKP